MVSNVVLEPVVIQGMDNNSSDIFFCVSQKESHRSGICLFDQWIVYMGREGEDILCLFTVLLAVKLPARYSLFFYAPWKEKKSYRFEMTLSRF